MSDLFPILPDSAGPPRFDDAVREAIARLERDIEQFEAMLEAVPQELLTEEEWRVIERAAADVEVAAEMAEDGYVAVAYDSHAWYRIMENLDRVANRLESATGIMAAARDRSVGG